MEINVTQQVDRQTALTITEMVHDILIDLGYGLTAFEWQLNVTVPEKEDDNG